MATWGPGLFDSDTALDVRITFENALMQGLLVEDATDKVLKEYQEWLQDEDDRPIVWLALAALQLEHNALQPEIRRQALTTIDDEDVLGGWNELGADDLAARKQILETLRVQLTS